ncbi:MAG: SPASM domain-containing protein, partial [Candidatus Thorarchaeota archaeon]
PCQYSDDVFMMIRADGTLVLCMYNDSIVNGGANPMGHLNKTDDLLEVYNNEAYTHFRNDQRNGVFQGPCRTCGFAFTGSGFTGEIVFRNEALYSHKVYYHRDYYNHFFSKSRKIRKNTFYGYQTEAHKHLDTYSVSELQYDGKDLGR